jgi:citrate lyase gamma subunit
MVTFTYTGEVRDRWSGTLEEATVAVKVTPSQARQIISQLERQLTEKVQTNG